MNKKPKKVIENLVVDADSKSKSSSNLPDEDGTLMIYGNIKIRDKETNEILVNKRF